MKDHGRYSKIFRRMWNDEGFRSLSRPQPCGQFLWMRLLCGPELGPIPGLFQAREPGLADALKWPIEPFRESFAELLRNGMAMADWEAGLVWVPGAIEYNEPANPNVVKSWADTWAELPECELKSLAHSALCEYLETRGETFASTFRDCCPNHSGNRCPNQDQDQEQDQEQEREREPSLPGNVNVKSAYDWLTYFQARYWELKGRQYGRGESDARALGALGTLLGSLPNEQRAGDWEARARIVEEFLASSDARTVSNGWSFSFFVSSFRGLAIPPEKRPKPEIRRVDLPAKVNYELRKPEPKSVEDARRKTWEDADKAGES